MKKEMNIKLNRHGQKADLPVKNTKVKGLLSRRFLLITSLLAVIVMINIFVMVHRIKSEPAKKNKGDFSLIANDSDTSGESDSGDSDSSGNDDNSDGDDSSGSDDSGDDQPADDSSPYDY